MNLQAKLNSLPFQPLLFIPKTVEELWHYASILTNNDTRKAGELALCYSAFAHHFDFDLGRVSMNTHVIQGKPCLNADGLAAIARSSGLIRFMRFTVLTDERCVYEMARVDEPEDVVHTYEYTIRDAEAAGHLNKAMWKKHRRSMIRVRALAGICRAVVPDAVSGVYSVDEMADSVNMSEQDRERITAQSIGEEVSRTPRPQRAPQPSRQPQPSRPPQPSAPVQPQPAPEPSVEAHVIQGRLSVSADHLNDFLNMSDDEREELRTQALGEEVAQPSRAQPSRPTPVRDFNSMRDLAKALDHHNIGKSEAIDVANRLLVDLEALSADQRRDFFYSWLICSTIRSSRLNPEWWRDMGTSKPIVKKIRDEFPALPLGADSRAVGKNLINPYFWESLSVSAHYEGEKLDQARQLMSEVISDGGSDRLLAQLSRL